jgi:hypothetical protein
VRVIQEPTDLPGSLTVVGTGIKAVAQVTQEAVSHIRRADRLVYLAGDPVTAQWLQDLNPSASSLSSSYAVGGARRDAYEDMVERVLEPVRAGQRVCMATYGHPGVCGYPGHEAVRRARTEGYRAAMLPGVSSQDCLFADLGIDPGRDGCQSYEATNFLLCRRPPDPATALVLWQVGLLGQTDYRRQFSTAGLPLLVEALATVYGLSHRVTLYENAVYPLCDSVIRQMELAQLPDAQVSWAMTLFVPPLTAAPTNTEMAARLAALLRT